MKKSRKNTKRVSSPTKTKTPYNFRSKAEEEFSKYLEANRIGYTYEKEVLQYSQTFYRKYRPDFNLTKKDGTLMHIEFKGWLRSTDRQKMIDVVSNNPTKDIRFVFMRDNAIYTGSKTKYSDWASENGFKYHVGTDLPESWIKELA